jgi:hypothetical protein
MQSERAKESPSSITTSVMTLMPGAQLVQPPGTARRHSTGSGATPLRTVDALSFGPSIHFGNTLWEYPLSIRGFAHSGMDGYDRPRSVPLRTGASWGDNPPRCMPHTLLFGGCNRTRQDFDPSNDPRPASSGGLHRTAQQKGLWSQIGSTLALPCTILNFLNRRPIQNPILCGKFHP